MRKGCGWTLVVLTTGVALAIGLLARRVDLAPALDDAARAVRDYRAQGLPWTAADVAHPVPESQNAAPLLRKAVALVEKLSFLSPKSPPDALDRYAPGMALAHEAATRPSLDFGRDPDLGLATHYPEHSPVVRLASAFALRARLRATKGDDAGALSDLDDARRLGILLAQEPDMNAALAGRSCFYWTFWAAQDCLAIASNGPERGRPLRSRYADASSAEALRKTPPDTATQARLLRYRGWLEKPLAAIDAARAWRGEIYVALATARNLSREQLAGFLLPRGLGPNPWKAPAAKPLRREGLPEDPLPRVFTLRCLRLNAELAAATHGLHDPLALVAERADAIRRSGRKEDVLSHALDDLLFPVYRRLDRTILMPPTDRALAIAYADALILHARTGRWPVTVATPDPMGTGPLHFRADGPGFRVWSVGGDGKDGGGRTWQESRAAHRPFSDDVVAVYPPVPRYRHR